MAEKIANIAQKYGFDQAAIRTKANDLGINVSKNDSIEENDLAKLHNALNFQYISKIEITNLWGTHNFVWELDRSVNILIGMNGSGKSTILNLVNSVINEGPTKNEDLLKYKYHYDEIIIYFNNDKILLFKKKTETVNSLAESFGSEIRKIIRKEAKENPRTKKAKLTNIREEITSEGAGYWASNYKTTKFKDLLTTKLISTFDNLVKDSKLSEFITRLKGVNTELDWDLQQLMGAFKNYQLILKQKESSDLAPFDAQIAELSRKKSANVDDLHKLQQILVEKEQIKENIHAKKNQLFEILNTLFNNTQMPELSKSISADADNNFVFIKNKNSEITLSKLSSGEKQLLILLMSAVLENEKPCVFLLDEPEISLHISWQEELVDCILKLNPNVQIIMVTHGTDMFLKDEWYFRTKNINKLLKKQS